MLDDTFDMSDSDWAELQQRRARRHRIVWAIYAGIVIVFVTAFIWLSIIYADNANRDYRHDVNRCHALGGTLHSNLCIRGEILFRR